MITPKDIREAKRPLEFMAKLLEDSEKLCPLSSLGKANLSALKTALETLEMVERLQAENTKLKNHLDIAYGEPSKETLYEA